MQRTYLGEFEEIVLFMVAVLDGEAYGVRISPGASAPGYTALCAQYVFGAAAIEQGRGFSRQYPTDKPACVHWRSRS